MLVTCPHCNATNNVAGLYPDLSRLHGVAVGLLYCGFCGASWKHRHAEPAPWGAGAGATAVEPVATATAATAAEVAAKDAGQSVDL